MCTDRAACSVPWAVLTPVACIVQVNLSTLLTGLGDGSLLCPTTSALGATVARVHQKPRALQADKPRCRIAASVATTRLR